MDNNGTNSSNFVAKKKNKTKQQTLQKKKTIKRVRVIVASTLIKLTLIKRIKCRQ